VIKASKRVLYSDHSADSKHFVQGEMQLEIREVFNAEVDASSDCISLTILER
jgi:hypothetical protein